MGKTFEEIAKEHKAGDEACGRDWTSNGCGCPACRFLRGEEKKREAKREIKARVDKRRLARWVEALKDPAPLVSLELQGGGTSRRGRSVMGYTLTIEVAEEFANTEKPALGLLFD